MQGTLVDEREIGGRTGGGKAGLTLTNVFTYFFSLSPSRVGITYCIIAVVKGTVVGNKTMVG